MEQETVQATSLIDLLNQLAEVPQPDPVSMVPQTGGWIVVAAIASVLLARFIWKTVARYRANAYRRDALHALSSAGDDAAQISSILKRTALAAYPRQRVASLSGEEWLLFLDQTLGSNAFSNRTGLNMGSAAYQTSSQVDGLNQLARDWVKKHRRESGNV